MRDIETIDSELQLVADLRRAARELGGPLPSSIDVADALLDERRRLALWPWLNGDFRIKVTASSRCSGGMDFQIS